MGCSQQQRTRRLLLGGVCVRWLANSVSCNGRPTLSDLCCHPWLLCWRLIHGVLVCLPSTSSVQDNRALSQHQQPDHAGMDETTGMAVARPESAFYPSSVPTRALLSIPCTAPKNRADTSRSRNTHYWYFFSKTAGALERKAYAPNSAKN